MVVASPEGGARLLMGGVWGGKKLKNAGIDQSYPQVEYSGSMSMLIASICLTASLMALVLSTVALVIHYVRRKETPEYTDLSSRIRALDAELIDLMDKVKHWRNRDTARQAREGSAKKAEEADEPTTPADIKARLRRKATAAGLGIAG